MGILEILFLFANLPLLLAFVFGWWKRPYWFNYLPFSAMLLAGSHLIFEGFRWQMIPGYGLTILLFLIMLPRLRSSSHNHQPQKALMILGGLTGLLLWGFAIALPSLFPIFRFPTPSGPYGIGTATYHWVDQTRPETFTDEPDDNRELMVQIWYPAELGSGGEPAPYLTYPEKVGPKLAKGLGLPPFVFGHLQYVMTNARLDAVISSQKDTCPVLIFSHGGNSLRVQNTFQVEELVSHGYVVASIDHPSVAVEAVYPDGRIVTADRRWGDRPFIRENLPILAEDASFVLNQLAQLNLNDSEGRFTGRLALDRVGIFGHSLGGIVAAEACNRAVLAFSRIDPALFDSPVVADRAVLAE